MKKQEKTDMPVGYRCILDSPRVPLNKSMTYTMLELHAGSEETLAESRKEIEDVSLVGKILSSRIDPKVTVTDDAWIFTVAQIATPGSAVMYAYTLSLISWLQEGKDVTMDTLVMNPKLFAWGIPDLEGDDSPSIEIWDEQKRRECPDSMSSDNWLDYQEFWDANRKHFWGQGLDSLPQINTRRSPCGIV